MSGPFLRADDIHARVDWPAVLAQLGIADTFLRLKKSGPCPACGGHDRYTFDNRHGRGDYICRGCTPKSGTGFDLLMRVSGCDYREARRRVIQAAALDGERPAPRPAPRAVPAPLPATPHAKARAVVRTSCAVADCAEAVAYLESRRLWPLPAGCTLQAHPSLDYWHEGQRIGRFPGLVAEVRDIHGEPVTAHVTYLQDGRKLATHAPRKILGQMTERRGCAARLLPPTGDVLGIAEGIETALSASALHGMPVWAALNASLLAKFEPPASVTVLHIYADGDDAGRDAALRLVERLQRRVQFEVHIPQAPAKDWSDELMSRASGKGDLRGQV
jgi:putative DNA primase/helicase